jgi:hypothetical protein
MENYKGITIGYNLGTTGGAKGGQSASLEKAFACGRKAPAQPFRFAIRHLWVLGH